MPKHLVKRYAPDPQSIREHKHLRVFGNLIHDPNLWHLNRRSVAGAFAVGLFWAFIPIPFQMLTAAATAIPSRVNLPISVALVWVTNPVTMPPMFYCNYLVGIWLLGVPAESTDFQPTLEWLYDSMSYIWQPLYLGSLVCGLIAAVSSYCVMRTLWRLHVIRQMKRKKQRSQSQG